MKMNRAVVPAGFDRIDRDQRQAQIAHFFEQAVQRRLIDRRAGQQRRAVVFRRDGQAAKPVGPLAAQLALEPDLIGQRFTGIRCGVEFV